MIDISHLDEGEHYWLKYGGEWMIGRWETKFNQFTMVGRMIVTPEHVQEIDLRPIRRKGKDWSNEFKFAEE